MLNKKNTEDERVRVLMITPMTIEGPSSHLSTLIPSPNIKESFLNSHLSKCNNRQSDQIHVHWHMIICILPLYPLCMLQKCLDVKFKQHKCLSTKQSSSESCGTHFFPELHSRELSGYIIFFSCDSSFVKEDYRPEGHIVFIVFHSEVLILRGKH